MRWPRLDRSRVVLAGLAALALLIVVVVWAMLRPDTSPSADPAATTLPVGMLGGGKPDTLLNARPAAPMPAGPPWRYGRSDARFTVIEYADLECPFCRAYFTVLKRWIDAHPDVAWQWHHLPLAMHEPAASTEARLVECVGLHGGQAAFWQAVEWVYAHTRGDGQGLPEGLRYPGLTPAAQQCVDGAAADAGIRAQAAEAAQQQIAATPTLRLQDRQSDKTLLLRGPVEGDALLSAIDLVAAGGADAAPSKEMPAESPGDMPR